LLVSQEIHVMITEGKVIILLLNGRSLAIRGLHLGLLRLSSHFDSDLALQFKHVGDSFSFQTSKFLFIEPLP
jgi:hypothetical protein